jgi:hypothetical protein
VVRPIVWSPALIVVALTVPALIVIFASCLVYFLRPRRVTALALVLAALFGAVDQYLGSFPMYPWMADISLLAAPWLVLAFVAGGSQRQARGGALLGLGCTFTALLGYGLMTFSPIEGAHLTVTSIAGFVYSESPVFVGGLVTGPLFGWFGQRWRVRRTWAGALLMAGTLCFEPFVHLPILHVIGSRAIRLAEVALGVAMATYIVIRTFVAPKPERQRDNPPVDC